MVMVTKQEEIVQEEDYVIMGLVHAIASLVSLVHVVNTKPR
jgi:hypothetical protein